MKKGLLLIAVILFFIFFPQKTEAQSPIQCGLLNEPCCNLAESPLNSCQTGLVCNSGVCISDGSIDTPPTSGSVDTTDTITGRRDNLWCDDAKTELNTAIGCIPILTSKEAFLSFLLKWAVGIGGGIAFLLIIFAGFMIMTSAGNPERLKAGQELLTSAISGLILLIFSVVILKIIGVDILGLDKFGFGK